MDSTTRTIICQCRRPNTTHARLTLTPGMFTLEYLNHDGEQFGIVSRETLPLNEYPELRQLHDGFAWRPEALWALLACLCVIDIEASEVSPDGIEQVFVSYRAKQKA